MTHRAVKFATDHIHWIVLLGIIAIGVWVRALGWNPNAILDYDPWWFFRHAQEILSNNFLPPKWDILSYFPPGRPVDYYLGWSYIIAVFYKITSAFLSISLTKFAGIFVTIFAASTAIPAYFVGKHVTNRWGGLATAFFAILTTTFISVSLAGYTDSDSTDAFFTFTSVITTLFAIKKSEILSFNREHFLRSLLRYLPFVIPAIISYWLFAFNWSSSWYIYFIFVAFIPLLVVFRVVEALFKREHKIGMPLITAKIRENRGLIFAILLIGLIGQAVSMLTSGWPTNIISPSEQLVEGLNIIGTSGYGVIGFVALFGIIGSIAGVAFGKLRMTVIGGLIGIAIAIVMTLTGVTGQALIVDQSVAELQQLNILTQFSQVMARVGTVPVVLAFAAFAITGLKLIFRKQVHTAEYFAIIWFIVSLFLITKGIRFSLLFSLAVATAAGFTVGNLIEFALARKSSLMVGALFAIFMVAGVMHFSDNYAFAKSAVGGLDVSDNFKAGLGWLKENADKDSLISTWWDPGHIITGSTGLKAMADGAHCGPNSCVFLDLNSRIQDQGRIFAISDENEAVKILSKYMAITPQQCQQLKEKFPTLFTPDACRPVSSMYVLATSDLIGKYYWLTYFGTGQGQVYTSCNYDQVQSQALGAPTYGCAAGVPTTLSLVQNGNQVYGILNSPAQGVRNVPVRNVMMFQNGQPVVFNAGKNITAPIDGLAYIDPSFGSAMYMQPSIENSIFTNMFFFDGKGNAQLGIAPLQKFKLVYSNPEMKIFKVDFTGVDTTQAAQNLTIASLTQQTAQPY